MPRNHRIASTTIALCLLAAPVLAQVLVGGEKPVEPNLQSDVPPLEAADRSRKFFYERWQAAVPAGPKASPCWLKPTRRVRALEMANAK